MSPFLPTIILRHRKENLKKCSLRGLEGRFDMQFYTYPSADLPPMENYILLSMEAPLLTSEDRESGIFLIDGTWKYAEKMTQSVLQKHSLQRRSLPSFCKTAYPRKQTGCRDPEKGLASIEALFFAYLILGRNPEGLLEHYHWKDDFLALNFKL
ncbi:MAG: hypothetical protein Tsb0015_04290 [Simkaniaceae bacterium]